MAPCVHAASQALNVPANITIYGETSTVLMNSSGRRRSLLSQTAAQHADTAEPAAWLRDTAGISAWQEDIFSSQRQPDILQLPSNVADSAASEAIMDAEILGRCEMKLAVHALCCILCR